MTSNENLVPMPAPNTKKKLVPKQHFAGLPITNVQRLSGYSPSDYEAFIQEWVFGYISPNYQAVTYNPEYHLVANSSGAGDKGRDIIAYTGEPASKAAWDNFQCKHYDKPLTPSSIWVELGKLCYYTFQEHYSVPRRYYFIAPNGVGPKLLGMIEKPTEFNENLMSEWSAYCENKISERPIPLDGSFRKYVEDFDFSIISYVPPLEIIAQHSQTPYHALRFGGLVLKMPDEFNPPSTIEPNEARYVDQLLEAYGDHKNCQFDTPQDLISYPKLERHFARAREYFYRAESLKVLSRDASYDGCEYDKLQDDIFHAVIDTVDDDSHVDGFARVTATTHIATTVSLESHVLGVFTGVPHKSGICHQLANLNRLKWVPK